MISDFRLTIDEPRDVAFFSNDLFGDFGVFGIEFDAVGVASAAQGRYQRGACACHRVEDSFPFLGEELDEFLRHGLREFGRVDEHALLARRRVVDEPGFLEFEPGFGVEVVEFVWAWHD